jgi:hypothetical protein
MIALIQQLSTPARTATVRAMLARWVRRTPIAAGLVAAALGIGATTATAQTEPVVTSLQKIDPVTGQVTDVPLASLRSSGGFNLFAQEDLAVASMRTTGFINGNIFNIGGPCPANSTQGGANLGACFRNNGTSWYFEQGFIGGAPPSDFRKIRAVYPGVNGMKGSFGYTTPQWNRITSGGSSTKMRWNPADGQFGRSFAGVVTTADGSCRDLTPGGASGSATPAGLTMLASKDCPATWAAGGFSGKLVVPDSVWLAKFRADPTNFRWDDWKLPVTQLDATNFLGAQSAYGTMSDYSRETKQRYGAVVPGGAGAPQTDGYPLGLEVRVDSWQFGSPTVRNTIWYQVTMVNKSADVYGRGVDYDSLYFGTTPGFLNTQQVVGMYFDPQTNAFISAMTNISQKCSGTYPRRYANTTTGACRNLNSAAAAIQFGVHAMQWLKSPLGDMRNKLFTNPQSPYYQPNSPLADDTITVNHAKPNVFGFEGNNVGRSERAGFGMISSTEDNYLDGRTQAEVGIGNTLRLWVPEFWGGDVSVPAKFTRFVPGSTVNPKTGQSFGRWDYNNDGVQDTIFMPQCGSQGCVAAFSDTSAGGYWNDWGNIQNSVTAGPFKLKAGDTTQFLWAYTAAPDTITLKQNVASVVDTYLGNYAGPAAIAFPTVDFNHDVFIESAELRDSVINTGATAGSQPSSVTAGRVTIRPPSINSVDPFFIAAVAKIRKDSADGDPKVRRVLALNPGILNQILARANDNLSEVLIFKSCDAGSTFTTSGGISANVGLTGTTCQSAPTRNVNDGPLAFPWRPWSRVQYVNGVPQTASIQETVQSGRSYLYSFVTRTRGLKDILVVDSIGGRIQPTDLTAALNLPIDTINGALARSGPTTAGIYVPVSLPAARSFARIDTSTMVGKSTQRLRLADITNQASGNFRVIFANRYVVRRTTDSLSNASSTTVQVQSVGPAKLPTGVLDTAAVLREYTFTSNANIPVRVGANLLAGTRRSTAGSARVFVDTVRSAAGSVGYAVVNDSARSIVFATTDAYGSDLTSPQLASPLYPGFTVALGDTIEGSTGFRQELLPNGTTRSRNFLIRAPGDTLVPNARQFAPQVLAPPVIANNRRVRGGQYSLTWLTDPWGPGAPFRITTPAETQAAISASLQQVATAAAQVTDTSARVATLVGATSARPLQRMRIPFVVTFRDAATGALDTVRFAAFKRTTNTRLLGSGFDTLRVTVPDTVWMPGDSLVALQKVERDSTVTGTVGNVTTRFTVVTADNTGGVAGFSPIRVFADSIGFSRVVVGCNSNISGVRPAADAVTCNPLAILTTGAAPAGGYLPVTAGWQQVFEVTRSFESQNVIALHATPYTSSNALTQAALNKIQVVPNPFIVRSEFDPIDGNRNATPRVLFTGVPEEGLVRIYSVSGQLLQVLSWTKADLQNIGQGTVVGDLPYDLRTREGLTLSSGLYMYVLQAKDSSGKRLLSRGKFVIIK